ncbi:DUF262 domain-containing protein [Microbacterium sediminis]|nr:DUF262 domain-containing protein [Microbacterium sediminis]
MSCPRSEATKSAYASRTSSQSTTLSPPSAAAAVVPEPASAIAAKAAIAVLVLRMCYSPSSRTSGGSLPAVTLGDRALAAPASSPTRKPPREEGASHSGDGGTPSRASVRAPPQIPLSSRRREKGPHPGGPSRVAETEGFEPRVHAFSRWWSRALRGFAGVHGRVRVGSWMLTSVRMFAFSSHAPLAFGTSNKAVLQPHGYHHRVTTDAHGNLDDSAPQPNDVSSDDLVNVDDVLDVDESEAAARNTAPLTYFGTEFDVHGLVRRFNAEAIIVPAFDPQVELPDPKAQGFQRRRVWSRNQMDRFIESLLLGFPVPGIFLVEQPGKKYLVLDGQQRLTTLAAFFGDRFKLANVEDKFKGLTYSGLTDEQRRALDDTFIQAVIIRSPASVDEYESVYQIFERLNSGGTNLQPHEIRVALYGGTTVDAIRELNNGSDWRALYGAKNARLKDQELILRVLALSESSDEYSAPLKSFLNDFLGNHRKGEGIDLVALKQRFRSSAQVLNKALGRRAFRLGTQVNAAILDSVFVGVMARLGGSDWEAIDTSSWLEAYESLIADEEYLQAVTKATANEESVSTRGRVRLSGGLSLRCDDQLSLV